MKLARFFSRIADAHLSLLGFKEKSAFGERLAGVTVALVWADAATDTPANRAGFHLAANLLARLYPSIRIDGPAPIADTAAGLIRAINPLAVVARHAGPADGRIVWGDASDGAIDVGVGADGWNVWVDERPASTGDDVAAPAALAAAALGVAELFRVVFAEHLDRRARRALQPGVLNIVTGRCEHARLPIPEELIDIGSVYLAGAGAVGEAAVEALRHTAVTGLLHVVDPERVELSNLQRYLLATNADDGVEKTAIIARALRGTRLSVKQIQTRWGADGRTAPGRDTVLCALDSAADRIAVQAGLPRRLYNAWTQPTDVGWSRHETFGADACLACLYLPLGKTPHLSELIARAIGQHNLRVAAYLVTRTPIGRVLPRNAIQAPFRGTLPSDAAAWASRAILDDVAPAFGLAGSDLDRWREHEIAGLYRDGICGGAIVRALTPDTPAHMLVPMAHQSALAGIMLATQLIVAQIPELREARAAEPEGRFNVLAGLPQHLPFPRQRTAGCLCADPDFVVGYRSRWQAG